MAFGGSRNFPGGMDGRSLKPIHLSPQHGQFPRLQDVVEASPAPKITTLLKTEVVDMPARPNPLDERSVLRSVGFGKVTVGAMNQHLASTSIVPAYLRHRRVSSIGLGCGDSQRAPRCISASCPLGVGYQAAREGFPLRASQAPEGNLSISLRRFRGGAEGIQWRTRPCTPARQLPAEGPIVRAGEQLERRFFSADQARTPGHFHVLECSQQQGTPDRMEAQNRPKAGAP